MTSSEVFSAATKILYQLCNESLQVGDEAPDLNDFSIFDAVPAGEKDAFMRLVNQDATARRAVGAMVGMAVADSVGHNFEFIPVANRGHRFCPLTCDVTKPYNRFNLKQGQWTDDTSMGLCQADSLLCRRGYSGPDMRVRFWNWWNRGYNNAFRFDDKRRNKDSVGLGSNIAMSLEDVRDAEPDPCFRAKGEDAGNGSLMRLAGVPIFFHSDEKKAVECSAQSSFTTHPGPTAAEACAFLGFCIVRAMKRSSSDATPAKAFLDKSVKDFLNTARGKSCGPALKKLLASKEKPGSKEYCWNWRDSSGPYLVETLKARGTEYNGYPVSSGYFGSYSMDGLAIALHSFYHTKSFMEAIGKCVNFLGDADSTGAICGQLCGAFYGVGQVHPKLLGSLRKWDRGEVALRGALLYALGLKPQMLAALPARAPSALPADLLEAAGVSDLRRENSDPEGSLPPSSTAETATTAAPSSAGDVCSIRLSVGSALASGMSETSLDTSAPPSPAPRQRSCAPQKRSASVTVKQPTAATPAAVVKRRSVGQGSTSPQPKRRSSRPPGAVIRASSRAAR
eukprot:TRINITY_DN10022_c0_g3_i1.p1 TRINITY_DN10022_c0_g3~~TRINITY_DN10022_c0_g3_i1.p1  ORF type:complete len:565 (+),score=76.62 TRINITY_DN10022_c0_g3_i1:74-1768(+)